MRPIAVPLILAAALAGTAAHAQAADPYDRYGTAPPASSAARQGYGQPGYAPGYDDPGYGYGYGDPGQAPAYGNPPPPPGGASYRDDERWSARDSYGSADARDDDDDRTGARQDRGGPAPVARPRPGVQNPRSRAYADRIARWRARADACEAGDLRACQGPDD